MSSNYLYTHLRSQISQKVCGNKISLLCCNVQSLNEMSINFLISKLIRSSNFKHLAFFSKFFFILLRTCLQVTRSWSGSDCWCYELARLLSWQLNTQSSKKWNACKHIRNDKTYMFKTNIIQKKPLAWLNATVTRSRLSSCLFVVFRARLQHITYQKHVDPHQRSVLGCRRGF